MHLSLFWSILAHLGLARSISAYLGLSHTIPNYLGLSGTIWDYLGLSGTRVQVETGESYLKQIQNFLVYPFYGGEGPSTNRYCK